MRPAFPIVRRLGPALAAIFLSLPGLALASLGWTTLDPGKGDHPVTVYYRTQAPERSHISGLGQPLGVARDGVPAGGNGRLVVISHGSGGSPWVFADLARSLVDAGFVVALPAHRGDSFGDDGHPGPQSWTRRPGEVSRAIDAVGRDPRFGFLRLDRVGLYGMSAGGHTALSLAGGRWSPALFRAHCDAHLAEDFAFCVGLATRLKDNGFDGLRRWIARQVIDWRFRDERLRTDADARIAAIVAAVPAAADFDMASLATPRVPLALVVSGADHWLVPRFHAGRVLEVCASCVRLVDLPDAGHGAALSPLPAGMDGLLGELLNDPPGYDRGEGTARIDAAVTRFFQDRLLP